ncbi:hypothetical protein ACOMHN_018890 [Nucella lapillus]
MGISGCVCVSSLFFFFCLFVSQVNSWSYTDQWNTTFPSHCNGQKQSPIDLAKSKVVYKEAYTSTPFAFTNFDNVNGITWSLKNNGHSAQVTYGGTAVTLKGGALPDTYQVAQFHFHWGSDNTKGSEHTVDGIAYPMELHVVTFNTKYINISNAITKTDGLAVLGFFFEIGGENAPMAKLVTDLAKVKAADAETTNTTVFALSTLLPATQKYYRYSGSLTTPYCNEVVTWTVFSDTIKVSDAQMVAFRQLQDSHNHVLQNNFRSVQALHSREVTSSFQVSAAQGPRGASLLVLMMTAVLLGTLGGPSVTRVL